jgi:ATP-dependent helicase/nuclease subunit B
MAVQVLVGRAGTGKSASCLAAIRERLRADAATGQPLVFLVPEQAAFQMERALIETPDIPAFARCHVISFRRLARRVLNETVAGRGRTGHTLSGMGRLMAIRFLLARHGSQLRVLGRAGPTPGMLTDLARSFDEWIQEALDPAALERLAAEATQRSDALAAGRLADLHTLYGAYLDFLAAGRLDPAEELAVALEHVARVAWLQGPEIWVDGFAGFTALERRMLVRLATLAHAMTITLLIDPDSPVLGSADVPVSRYSLFARTERSYVALRDAMVEAGVEWRAPRRLAVDRAPRFASDDLAKLERVVFRVRRRPDDGAATAPAAVRLVAAANRRVEVDAAVVEVERLVRVSDGRLRYRDIAIIVRDLEPYHDLLSAALAAHAIPFFIDRRRRTAHHPLVELLRALPELIHHDFRPEQVRLLLKTGLSGLCDEEADALENYVLAHGIAGREAWLAPADWTYRRLFTQRDDDDELTEPERVALEAINASRRRFVEPLRDWIAAAVSGAPMSGRQWAEALYATMTALGVAGRIEAWAAQAEGAGETDEAESHRQVWRDAMTFLDDFAEALGDTELTSGEVTSVLDAALAEFTLGLSPPTLDQVLIGSIERSRHPELAAVLLLGFNEGLFPLTPGEDAVLTDAERDGLAARGTPVGTPRYQRILDEKMLAYIAMTRPSRSLWISYARADDDGRPLTPSPYVDPLRAAMPGLAIEHVEDPLPQRALWTIGTGRELGARLALELRSRPAEPVDDPEPVPRARWNDLYARARDDEALAHDALTALTALRYANEPALDADAAQALVSRQRHFSASEIETYARCPFQHFARYALGLEPRVEFVVQAIDFGRLHHKLLEAFFAELIDTGRNLGDMPDEAIAECLKRVASRWTAAMTDEALLDDARNRFLIERSNDHLREAVRRLRLLARHASVRPAAVEWTFGMTHGERRKYDANKPLTLHTPAGRTIELVGKVDRVDLVEVAGELLGVVLDYKRRPGRTLPLWKVLHGLDLQLLTYMLALLQRGETIAGRPITPIGAFYAALAPQRETVDHPDAAPSDDELGADHKPRGVIDADRVELLDRELTPGSRSAVLNVRRNKDGHIGNRDRSDAIEGDELGRVTAYARHKIGSLADHILDGDVTVRPYQLGTEMPCTFCEFRAVCRFDREINEPIALDKPRRDAALAAMDATTEGRADA